MKRLRLLREERGLSQRKLGEALDVAQETISGYETGRTEPGLEALGRMADFFGVSVDYLLGRGEHRLPLAETDLTAEEMILVQTYRGLSMAKRELVNSLILSIRN